MRASGLRRDDQAQPPVAAEKLYAVFGVGKKRYAIDADRVCEILRERPVAEVPAAGKSVRGAIFFRGACVTVFDLGWKLAGTVGGKSQSARVIVLTEPRWAALRVDSVIALTRDCALCKAEGERSSGRDARFINGSIEWNGKPVDVIDVDKVMTTESHPNTPGDTAVYWTKARTDKRTT